MQHRQISAKTVYPNVEQDEIMFQEESQEQNPEDYIGIKALLSHKHFKTNSSSIYLYPVKSFFDTYTPHDLTQQQLTDKNVYFSTNISAFFKLLRIKLKNLANAKIFHDTDRTIINYSLLFGSVLALNQAKNQIIQKNQQNLRNQIKEKISKIISKEQERRDKIHEAFLKSTFFNSESLAKKMEKVCRSDGMGVVLDNLCNIKFENMNLMKCYLRNMLSWVSKAIIQNQKNLTRGRSTIINSEVILIIRQFYICLLIVNYISIYLINSDWLTHLVSYPQIISELYFQNIVQPKGFHILHRLMEDVPVKLIAKEIQTLQKIYTTRSTVNSSS